MRTETIVARAERELAADLLTHSSNNAQRSLLLLPAALTSTSTAPCPQDKGIREDKGDTFCPVCQHELTGAVCVLFRLNQPPPTQPLHHDQKEWQDRNEQKQQGGKENNRQNTDPHVSPSLFNRTCLFPWDGKFQQAALREAKSVHSLHQQGRIVFTSLCGSTHRGRLT